MLMERGAAAAEYPALARVRTELEAFKRKFYLNLLVRGLLVASGLLLTFFVVFNGLEYFLYLPTVVRAGLLFGFIGPRFTASHAGFGRRWRPSPTCTGC